jgi:hypothetical protein
MNKLKMQVISILILMLQIYYLISKPRNSSLQISRKSKKSTKKMKTPFATSIKKITPFLNPKN